LKIQPATCSHVDHALPKTTGLCLHQESIPATPTSQTDANQRKNQSWSQRPAPITPNSNFFRRSHHRSTGHQRSLNSSGDSSINRSFMESPKSVNNSLMKSTRSDTNLSLSPISMNRMSPMRSNRNPMQSSASLTSSGTIVTDYRQSTAMKRIVNP
jgi:hypothetical protein